MRGDERPAAVDHGPAVRLERVGRVVERDAEQQPDAEVDKAIEQQLEPRIVDRRRPRR